ncbi:hypothetical protein DXG01_014395 [Tephrocybe rancida]|nr:hypothetical protein DXG01_014395 [Tephrocybe rancida]
MRQCSQGGIRNAEILVALGKYPHLGNLNNLVNEMFIYPAVRSNDLEIREAMLTIGWDPNTMYKYMDDALTLTVMFNNLPVVCWLLDHQVLFEETNAALKNSRALEQAAKHGRLDTMAYLLSAEIDEIAEETSYWIEGKDMEDGKRLS